MILLTSNLLLAATSGKQATIKVVTKESINDHVISLLDTNVSWSLRKNATLISDLIIPRTQIFSIENNARLNPGGYTLTIKRGGKFTDSSFIGFGTVIFDSCSVDYFRQKWIGSSALTVIYRGCNGDTLFATNFVANRVKASSIRSTIDTSDNRWSQYEYFYQGNCVTLSGTSINATTLTQNWHPVWDNNNLPLSVLTAIQTGLSVIFPTISKWIVNSEGQIFGGADNGIAIGNNTIMDRSGDSKLTGFKFVGSDSANHRTLTSSTADIGAANITQATIDSFVGDVKIGGYLHSHGLIYSDSGCYTFKSNARGTYIGIFKYRGALPGYATDYFPVIRSDYVRSYFVNTNNTVPYYVGWIGYNGGGSSEIALQDTSGVNQRVSIKSDGPSYLTNSLKVAACTTSTLNTGKVESTDTISVGNTTKGIYKIFTANSGTIRSSAVKIHDSTIQTAIVSGATLLQNFFGLCTFKRNVTVDSNLNVNRNSLTSGYQKVTGPCSTLANMYADSVINAKLGYKINSGDLISVYDTGSYPCTVFVNATRYGVMTNRIVYSILNGVATIFIPQIYITLSGGGIVSVKIPTKLQPQSVNDDLCTVVEGTTKEVAHMETYQDITITTISDGAFSAGDFVFRPKTIAVTLNNDQAN